MAELNYGQFGDDQGVQLPGLKQVINFTAAVVSVGLIAGLGWWGYQLVVRDVSGVPVVRALEGPMRVAPEEPGGMSAAHQGLAVNNIPAAGEAAAPADQLVLAPHPLTLSDEDKTGQELSVLAATEKTDTSVLQATDDVADPAPVIEAGVASETTEPADQAALIAATLEGVVTEAVEKPLVLVPADLGGVTKSAWPVPRPEGLIRVAAAAPSEPGALSIAPADIPEGTRLAQLGAFDSAAQARGEWSRIAALLPEFMTDKARVIEEAQSGGKIFYRLRAHGFADLADARRFCAALQAASMDCIPVRQR